MSLKIEVKPDAIFWQETFDDNRPPEFRFICTDAIVAFKSEITNVEDEGRISYAFEFGMEGGNTIRWTLVGAVSVYEDLCSQIRLFVFGQSDNPRKSNRLQRLSF